MKTTNFLGRLDRAPTILLFRSALLLGILFSGCSNDEPQVTAGEPASADQPIPGWLLRV